MCKGLATTRRAPYVGSQNGIAAREIILIERVETRPFLRFGPAMYRNDDRHLVADRRSAITPGLEGDGNTLLRSIEPRCYLSVVKTFETDQFRCRKSVYIDIGEIALSH